MRCLKVLIPNILAELFQSEGTRGGDGKPPPLQLYSLRLAKYL